MTTYICPRCNYKTNRKSNLKHHITRKNVCKPINSDVAIKSIAKTYGINISPTEKEHEDTNVYNSDVDTIIHVKHTQDIHKTYRCKYCNKPFNSSTSRCRHQRSYCKNKDTSSKEYNYMKKELEKIKEEADKKLKQQIEEIKKEVEEKYEVIADKKAQKMVLCLVDKLVPNQTTNSHNTNNSHNNIVQNNNIQNNNNNLKINNFGEEKTKYITDSKLKIMFVDPRNVIVQHIKDTYYHVLHPENFNAKITNCKSKHMHILKENKWEKVNKQLTICSMYNKHEKIIESEFERLKPELTETVRDNYKDYKQSTLHSFNTFKHRMVDIEAVIINGTKEHTQIDLLSEKEVARLAKEQGKTPGEIFAEHMPDIFAERDE